MYLHSRLAKKKKNACHYSMQVAFAQKQYKAIVNLFSQILQRLEYSINSNICMVLPLTEQFSCNY